MRSVPIAVILLLGLGCLAASSACREQTVAQATSAAEGQPPPAQPPAARPPQPESDADHVLRHELSVAIAQDPALKERPISFTVDNGDVTVTGTVRTETERQKINELALHINGVKSVANALRVSPG